MFVIIDLVYRGYCLYIIYLNVFSKSFEYLFGYVDGSVEVVFVWRVNDFFVRVVLVEVYYGFL